MATGMIEKIKIKKFGRFQNFDNSEIKFKNFNLFYGWNYSGKTTLSRIFALFDTKHKREKILESYDAPEFSIFFDDNTTVTQQNLDSMQARVFNSDYIKDNLKFDDSLTEPIFILGEDTLAKQEELDKLVIDLENKNKVITNIKESILQKKDYIENIYRCTAKQIKDFLLIPNFDIRDIDKCAKEISSKNLNDFILQEDSRIALENEYRMTDEKDDILGISISTYPNVGIINQVLKKVATPSQSLEYLQNAPELSEWTRTGKELHRDSRICLFCRQTLPSDFMDNLNKHFNKETEELRVEVDTAIRTLSEQKNDIEKFKSNLYDKTRFYKAYEDAYQKLKDELENNIDNKLSEYTATIQILTEKVVSLTTPIDKNIEIDFSQINDIIVQINNLIGENRTYKDNLAQRKEDIKNRLVQHHTATILLNETFITYARQIEEFSADLIIKDAESLTLKNEIGRIKAEISELHKGAETVNKYLEYFFGETSKIKIVVESDKTKLNRDDRLATNLSEGEKTAIAISHYLTSLDSLSDAEKKNIILYIDDPISSLDSNHIYAVYSKLINLNNIFKQVFIATHSHEFYKLCMDAQGKTKKIMVKYYIVRKSTTSLIEKIPDVYEKFKSEYSYLFYILYNFLKTPDPDDLYQISNVARRYVEMFTGFKVPLANNYQDKLGILLSDDDKATKIMKCFHSGSHSQLSSGFKDLSSTEESIKEILKMVEDNDLEHYNCLVKIAKEANGEIENEQTETV